MLATNIRLEKSYNLIYIVYNIVVSDSNTLSNASSNSSALGNSNTLSNSNTSSIRVYFASGTSTKHAS